MSLDNLENGNNIDTATNLALLKAYSNKLSRTEIMKDVTYKKIRKLRKDRYSGSGVITKDNYHHDDFAIYPGSDIWSVDQEGFSNVLGFGFSKWTYFPSGKDFLKVNVDGHELVLRGTNNSYQGEYDEFSYRLPPSDTIKVINDRTSTNFTLYKGEIAIINNGDLKEDIILVTESISKDSNLDNSSDKYTIVESVSRKDLTFLEVWVEDVDEKDFVFPYGNVQYNSMEKIVGLPDPIVANFSGFETYSLYGDYQEINEHLGHGYRWSQLSDSEKLILIKNPDHNLFIEDNILRQVRYRVRSIRGYGDDLTIYNDDNSVLGYNNIDSRVVVKGSLTYIESDHSSNYDICYSRLNSYPGTYTNSDNSVQALLLTVTQRLNHGVFHPLFNPYGTAKVYKDGNIVNWYEATDIIKDLKSCFDGDNIAYINPDNSVTNMYLKDTYSKATGSMASGITGRDDGNFIDGPFHIFVEDLRADANKYSNKTLLQDGYEDLVSGRLRGSERVENYKELSLTFKIASKHNGVESSIYYKLKYNETVVDRDSLLDFKGGIAYNVTKSCYYYINDITDDNGLLFSLYKNVKNDLYNSKTIIDNIDIEDEIILLKKGDRKFRFSNQCTHYDILGNLQNLPDNWKRYGIPNSIGKSISSMSTIGETIGSKGGILYYLSRSVNPINDNYKIVSVIVYNKRLNQFKTLPLHKDYNGLVTNGDVSGYYCEDGKRVIMNLNGDGSFSDYENSILLVGYESVISPLSDGQNEPVTILDKSIKILSNPKIYNSYNVVYKLLGDFDIVPEDKFSLASRLSSIGLVSDNRIDTEYGQYPKVPINYPLVMDESGLEDKPLLKLFSYLSDDNNYVRLNIVYQELKQDRDLGNGDDGLFYIDADPNVRLDKNGNPVIYGIASMKINKFINKI